MRQEETTLFFEMETIQTVEFYNVPLLKSYSCHIVDFVHQEIAENHLFGLFIAGQWFIRRVIVEGDRVAGLQVRDVGDVVCYCEPFAVR